MTVKPAEALLSFFTGEGVGRALEQSGLTVDEVFRILAQIAREGKTDQGRLSAIKLIFERAEMTLRLERLLLTETDKTISGVNPDGQPFTVRLIEEERRRLTQSSAETERELQRFLNPPTVIDVDPSTVTVTTSEDDPDATD